MLKQVNIIMQHVQRNNSTPFSIEVFRGKENDGHLIDIADGVNKYLLFAVSKFWCSANGKITFDNRLPIPFHYWSQLITIKLK